MSGNHSDVSNQLRSINADQVLIEDDHSLLGTQIHVGDSLCIFADLYAFESLCELFVTVNILTLAGVNDSLCNFLEESKVVCVNFLGNV